MPRMLLSFRTERTISWLARRIAFSTRRAGTGRPASPSAGERNEAGTVGSLRGSEPEMCLSIDSTARRDATSPAACPPIPSATMSSVWSSEMAKESALGFRRRPTSDRPANSINRRACPSPAAVLPLDTSPLLLLPGRQQFVQPGDGRLVVRLERQDAPQLLDGLLLLPRLRQREGQVETRERILRIRQERLAKSGDGLDPALQLAQGDADVVVDVGEIRIEQTGLAEVLHGALELAVDQKAQRPPVVEREALGPSQEGLAHPLLGLPGVAARQRLARLLERFLDGVHREIARRGELPRRLVLLARRQQQECELDAGFEVAGVDGHGAPEAFNRLQAEPEARVKSSHPEMDIGILGRQRQRVAVPLHGSLQVALLLEFLGRGDVGLGQVVDRQPPVGFRRLRGLQDTGQELDRLFRLAAVVVVQTRLQLVIAEQVADGFEQAHQWAAFFIFFGGCVRTRNRLRAWRRTSSGMFLSPVTTFRSRLPRRGRNCRVSPGGVLGLRTRAWTVA